MTSLLISWYNWDIYSLFLVILTLTQTAFILISFSIRKICFRSGFNLGVPSHFPQHFLGGGIFAQVAQSLKARFLGQLCAFSIEKYRHFRTCVYLNVMKLNTCSFVSIHFQEESDRIEYVKDARISLALLHGGHYFWKLLDCNLPPGKYRTPGKLLGFNALTYNGHFISQLQLEIGKQVLFYSAKGHFPAF